MKHYYLAHSRADQAEVRQLELGLEKQLGFRLVNPFWDISDKFSWETNANLNNGHSHNLTDDECDELVDRDFSAIDASDGLVLMALKPAHLIGASMEVLYAFLSGKPIYVYARDADIAGHAWLRAFADYITNDISAFTKHIEEKVRAVG